MRPAIHLTIMTPDRMVCECEGVVSFRGADASGGFGIEPGHADLLTALSASVVQWRTKDDGWHYCAVRGGVLKVTGGERMDLACREAVLGDDLAALEERVRQAKADRIEADRKARTEQVRIHTLALRQILRYLMPGSQGGDGMPYRGDGNVL